MMGDEAVWRAERPEENARGHGKAGNPQKAEHKPRALQGVALTDDDVEMVSGAGEEHPYPEESEQPGKVGAVMILIPEGEGS